MRTLQASEHRHRSRQASTPDALGILPGSIGRTGEELLAAALADATGNGFNVADAAILYATKVEPDLSAEFGRSPSSGRQDWAKCAGRVGQCGMTVAIFTTGHDVLVHADFEQARSTQ
jgi:hypothetical protein